MLSKAAFAFDPVDIILDLGRQSLQARLSGGGEIWPQLLTNQEGRLAIGRNEAVEHNDDQHRDKKDAHGAQHRARDTVEHADIVAGERIHEIAQKHADEKANRDEHQKQRDPGLVRRYRELAEYGSGQLRRQHDGDRGGNQIGEYGGKAAQHARLEAHDDGKDRDGGDNGVEGIHWNRSKRWMFFPDGMIFGGRIMKKLFIAAAIIVAGTSAALAQGFVYYGSPSGYVYQYSPGYAVYGYAPVYAGAYGTYYAAPGYWYGDFDDSDSSVRQPNPHSTIRSVR